MPTTFDPDARWSTGPRDILTQANVRRIGSCQTKTISRSATPFERTSKRRRGYPSETRVKRGFRVVHAEKELIEKLGRNDLCPCGSGRRFQEVLPP